MALLLAPYNDAMCLGWTMHIVVIPMYRELRFPFRFNSFTQQVCINNAVKPEGGRLPALEQDLYPQYKLGTMTAMNGDNVDISQDVSWTAKFMDLISTVTDSMNISGMSLFLSQTCLLLIKMSRFTPDQV